VGVYDGDALGLGLALGDAAALVGAGADVVGAAAGSGSLAQPARTVTSSRAAGRWRVKRITAPYRPAAT
jgi:hypothetical protein